MKFLAYSIGRIETLGKDTVYGGNNEIKGNGKTKRRILMVFRNREINDPRREN